MAAPRVPGNALKITATLYGYEGVGPELKSAESSIYNSTTKATTKVTKYWYQTTYKHPIGLRVESPTGEVLMDETFAAFNESTVVKTAEAEKVPPMDPKTYVDGLQNKVVETNMKVINEYINANYGFSKLKRTTKINRVESKQLNYDDYQKAFEAAAAGYNLLANGVDAAKPKIDEAIAIWEAAMKESNIADKKARINTDVTIATLFNLAEGYIWINDYKSAEARLNKITGLKPSKKEEKLVEAYLDFLKDQKVRFEANM
jgi:hypothetical protein